MSEEPLEARIQDYLEGVGAPLEMRVLEAFAGKNTGRLPGYRYLVGNEIREIDLIATFEDHQLLDDEHVSLLTTMVIECKKSLKHPWIFFNTKTYAWADCRPFLLIDAPIDDQLGSLDRLPQVTPALRRIDCHLAAEQIPMAINYDEAFKKTGAPSSIYSAIDSVSTYLQHARGRRPKSDEVDGVVRVFFPVIVIDGVLTTATRIDDHMHVEVVDHVRLRTWTGRDLLVIDVVTPSAFEKLVDEVARFHTEATVALSRMSLPDEIRLKLKLDDLERRKEPFSGLGEFLVNWAIANNIDLNQSAREIQRQLEASERQDAARDDQRP